MTGSHGGAKQGPGQLGENLGCRGQTKRHRLKLVEIMPYSEAEKAPEVRQDAYVKVHIGQVKGHHIVTRAEQLRYHLYGDHFKTASNNEFIEQFHIECGSHLPIFLRHEKDLCIEAYCPWSWLYRPFA